MFINLHPKIFGSRNSIKSNQENFVALHSVAVVSGLPQRIQQEILNRFNDQLGADVEQCDKHQELILFSAFDARDGFVVVVYLSVNEKHQLTHEN